MNALDVAEFNTRESAKFSLEGLHTARTRAHALLLVMLGGGGALGAVGLAQLVAAPLLGTAALAASAWWFAWAAWVARRALTSAPVRSWAVPGLADKHQEWLDYAKEAAMAGTTVDALSELRLSALRSAERAAAEYREASTAAYSAVDTAYKMLAATPLVALVGVAAAVALQRWGSGFLS